MMEVELQMDVSKLFTYKAMERATGGVRDPVSCIYEDEDALYVEGVAEDMVADVPGYTPLEDTMSPEADEPSECISSPKYRK